MEIHDNLSEKYLELASEWHPERNGSLRPLNIPAKGSKKKFYWKCKDCGYTWQASLDTRIKGSGCPACAGRVVVPGVNDLLSQMPEVAKEWHPTKNGTLKPEEVARGSGKLVWWKCGKGHEWRAAVCDRVRGTSCPFCAGKKVLPGFNDMASSYPELAKEWALNINKKAPNEVTPGSRYKAKWCCKKCGHIWTAAVYSRTAGTGCPECAKKRLE